MSFKLTFLSILLIICVSNPLFGEEKERYRFTHDGRRVLVNEHPIHDRGMRIFTIITPSGRIETIFENWIKKGSPVKKGDKLEVGDEYYSTFKKQVKKLKMKPGKKYEILHVDYEKDDNVVVTVETPRGERLMLDENWLDRTAPIRPGATVRFNNSLTTQREFKSWKKMYPTLSLVGHLKVIEVNRAPWARPRMGDLDLKSDRP